MNQQKLDKKELDEWTAFKKEHRISDNISTGEVPKYILGKWQFELRNGRKTKSATGKNHLCECSTCSIMRA